MVHSLGPDLNNNNNNNGKNSLYRGCEMCCLPDPCQFTSTEVYSEPAINCVWHLKSGVVNLSLEYLVVVEVWIQNILLFLFDLFQLKKNPHHQENNNSLPVACC